jgi:hypothetical protein
MRSPAVAFRDLEKALEELRAEFLAPHVGASLATPSRQYILAVRAYTVLAHAEFEQFFEDLAQWVQSHAERVWLVHRRASVAVLAMAISEGNGLAVEGGGTLFDAQRCAIEKAKKALGKQAADQNNGIAPKYLRKLFWSVGVELPDEANGLGSIQTLATWRGDQAHHSVGVAKVVSVEDALKTVEVCLGVARILKKSSVRALAHKR